jgi:hypothetical protein
MLKCWPVEDRLRFLHLLQNCVSVGYGYLLFHQRYATNTIILGFIISSMFYKNS